MLHEEHEADYKRFRAKAKSWEVSRHHKVLKEHLHQLTTEAHHDLDGSHMDVENESCVHDEELETDALSQISQIPPPEQQTQQTHRHPVIKMRTKIV